MIFILSRSGKELDRLNSCLIIELRYNLFDLSGRKKPDLKIKEIFPFYGIRKTFGTGPDSLLYDKQKLKNSMLIFLTFCCFAGGYAFYKMNPHDLFPAIAFGLGLVGIMMSFARNTN